MARIAAMMMTMHVHDLFTIMIITKMVLVVRLPLTVVRAIQLELNLLAAAMLLLQIIVACEGCDSISRQLPNPQPTWKKATTL